MKVSFRILVVPAIAVTAVLLAGCPLPYDYKGPGAGNSQASDPSSPNVTAPVVVSYSVQGGSSGTVADGGSFYSGQTTTVTLSTATAGAVIFYTASSAPLSLATLSAANKINGSSGTLTVSRTTTVQSLNIYAVAIGPNMLPSTIVHAIVGVSPYPILSISSNNASMSENSGTATFTITSSSAPAADITVNLLTGGDAAANYATSSGAKFLTNFIATLKKGTTSVSLPMITGVHDADGINETVTLTIQPDTASPTTYSVGAPATAGVVIQDDHVPVLTITPPNPSSIPDNGAPAVFMVSSSFAPSTALTVNLVTGGFYKPSDVSGLPSQGSSFTLTLPAGATTVTDTVTPHPDPGDYNYQTVTVSLAADPSYSVGSPSSAAVTLVDTSPVATLTLTAFPSAVVDGEISVVTVFASVAPDAPLTVNLSSSGYKAGKVIIPSSVVIPAGATSASFNVVGPTQIGYEQQTPQVSLAPGVGYTIGSPGSVSITIFDGTIGPFTWNGVWNFNANTGSNVGAGTSWTLKGNVTLFGGALNVGGTPFTDDAEVSIPSLDPNRFTLAVKFAMSDFSAVRPVIAGGFLYRWMIVYTDPNGGLSLHFNNHAVVLPLGFTLAIGVSYTLVLDVDLTALTVTAWLNGVPATVGLPAGFTLIAPASDYNLEAADEGNNNTFKGLWDWVLSANGLLDYNTVVNLIATDPDF